MSCGLRFARRPCSNCPWRLDVEPGEFPAGGYEALRDTVSGQVDAPFFACHKSREGCDIACAGWLAVAGPDHIGVRIALVYGRLDPAALTPGEDWPPLHASYDEMAGVKAGDR